ncbi:hypothetical protein GCM10009751_09110 [Myceligenerans crystallogenes]|uniref:Uncharacterized protein n=1 Tax=Myceligenerans crystallogenes TaxID=316335 RepID=A0ABN2N6H8_9MICO
MTVVRAREPAARCAGFAHDVEFLGGGVGDGGQVDGPPGRVVHDGRILGRRIAVVLVDVDVTFADACVETARTDVSDFRRLGCRVRDPEVCGGVPRRPGRVIVG